MPLSAKDKGLVRLFVAACFHRWDILPELCRAAYRAGATVAEVRGTVRHLIICAGYASCLAATNHLHAAKLLEEDVPGKAGGPPGNAFQLVYTKVTDAVRQKLHTVDPVLAEYIRMHLYGDIYSSPEVELRQRQLFMCAFLAEANMHEELFGHMLAALRFGNDREACRDAVDIAFELKGPTASNTVYKAALIVEDQAYKKFRKDFPDGPPPQPQVQNPDPQSVRLPPPAPLVNTDVVPAEPSLADELREKGLLNVEYAWENLPKPTK
ncbi:hypothetical protein WJX72_012357 [[Myrmecia] bisecta]|uniref:Carboxymuconolactone decarboxylase-like domain-containing protein n=1 Tax=[Myrmecia] bisecta TaxID=41462 RepID=A0AAW1PY17_9CHLO